MTHQTTRLQTRQNTWQGRPDSSRHGGVQRSWGFAGLIGCRVGQRADTFVQGLGRITCHQTMCVLLLAHDLSTS